VSAGHPGAARQAVTTPTTQLPLFIVTDRTPAGARAVSTTTSEARERRLRLMAATFCVWAVRECQPGMLAMLDGLTDRQLVAFVAHEILGLSYQKITDLIGLNQKRGQKQHVDAAVTKMRAAGWHTDVEGARRLTEAHRRRNAARLRAVGGRGRPWTAERRALLRQIDAFYALDALMRDPGTYCEHDVREALKDDLVASLAVHQIWDLQQVNRADAESPVGRSALRWRDERE